MAKARHNKETATKRRVFLASFMVMEELEIAVWKVVEVGMPRKERGKRMRLASPQTFSCGKRKRQ